MPLALVNKPAKIPLIRHIKLPLKICIQKIINLVTDREQNL
jgi:hypothetical protein